MSDAASPWTIRDLGAAVERALASIDYQGAENGQVRAVPNQRTIRYYTTIGLIDRPAAFKGRTAFYNHHHLLQLVAIKRLQATGMPLVEVQETLNGITPAALADLAQVDDALFEPSVDAAPAEMPSRRTDFWAVPAAALDLDNGSIDDDHGGDGDEPEPNAASSGAPAPRLQGIRASDVLTLLVDATRAITDDDEEAIRNAAAPLLAVLHQRGLVPASDEGDV